MSNIKADQFIPRLHLFAQSFTGYPVRIFTTSSLRERTLENASQIRNFLRIAVPDEVGPSVPSETDEEKRNDIALKVYKGIVSLQASASLFKGILTEDIFNRHFINRESKSPIFLGISSIDDLVKAADSYSFLPLSFNTIELARRMQCIREYYPVLGEDIGEGFRSVFNANVFRGIKRDLEFSTNEIDLALSRVYWEHMGIEPNRLDDIVKNMALDRVLGDFRSQLYSVIKSLSTFSDPVYTTCSDSVKRVMDLKEYLNDLMRDLDMGSILFTVNDEFVIAQAQKVRISDFNIEEGFNEKLSEGRKKRKESRKKELEVLLTHIKKPVREGEIPMRSLLGLESAEEIQKRITALERTKKNIVHKEHTSEVITLGIFGAIGYSKLETSYHSLRAVFQETPKKQIISLDIPKSLEKGLSGKSFYFPEMRDSILHPDFVRVTVYDLRKGKPESQEQFSRQSQLKGEIELLESKVANHDRKIRSDVNYIYDLQEEVRERDAAKRKIAKLRKEYDESRKVHTLLTKRPIKVDIGLIKRIERAMERIKPQVRTMVRNCFEGELDEKKFYEYWLESRLGGSPLPNFFYQWQKRRRDIASVLLIDASNSVNRIIQGNEAVLDVIKRATYYLNLGAEFLEDKIAVLAYNGRGNLDSRIFILKDFNESSRHLKERLELLSGEVNNRDGSAIRYAAQYLKDYPAKTRFLFHLGDMNPSDLVYEQENTAIQTFPYEGSQALADVYNAFMSARSYGIIPVGICIMPIMSEKSDRKILKSKLNPVVLAKLKEQKAKSSYKLTDDFLKRSFRRNYKVIHDVQKLPEALKDVYLRVSFS